MLLRMATNLWLRLTGAFPATVSRFKQEEMTVHLDERSWAAVYAIDTEPGISNSGKPMLAVTSRHSVPKEWVDVLAGVAIEQWPDGFVPHTPNEAIFDYYPAGLQDFLLRQEETLQGRAHECWGLVRWRWSDAVYPGRTLKTPTSMSWSTDSENWERVRMRLELVIGPVWPQLSLNAHSEAGLQDLASARAREPVGREIWHVASTADPLTAAILAVTAVEVEVKRLIAELVAPAQWLVTNAPTPPISRLIWEYLPTLDGFDRRFTPPKRLKRSLEDAVRLRNRTVHGGPPGKSAWSRPAIPLPKVREVLATASDLLWIFDAQRGYEWALDKLTAETYSDLRLPVVAPPPEKNSPS